MLFVPGGTFPMGDAEGFPDELPVTPVTVRSFCLDATEVTVSAYAACARDGLCTPAHARAEWSTLRTLETNQWAELCNRDRPERGDHPVNCVVWDQGERYCTARGLRLPSEAEWEYAARGGDEARRFPWGDALPTGQLANLCGTECGPVISAIRGSWSPLHGDDDGWPATAPVGSFPRGDARWGHHDLTGNVCEWVKGRYCPYDQPDCGAPETPMCRGNHFLANKVKKARPGRRNRDDRWHRSPDVGFRCAADAGLTEPRAPASVERVTVYPELPSFPRVAILAALAALAGAALAGFGGAAAGIVVALLIYVGQLAPRTAIATAFAVVGAAHAASLAAPALRRRVEARVGGPMGVAAFAAAFAVGALVRFVPERLLVGLVALAVLATGGAVARRARRPEPADSADKPWPGLRPLRVGGAVIGALSGATGVTLTALHAALLRRLTALPAADRAATAALPALLTALGGALGYATHARPDLGLGVVMGVAAALGALLRALAPARAPSRAGQAVLALALIGLGLVVFAREVLPAEWFPDL
jgi:formylglycine-generating enzyme required for sulfatase activity/uncharacterized membrane protein YfcA